jgi:hypothetical protein
VKGIVVACKKFLRESELSAEGDAVPQQSDLAVAIMDKVTPRALPDINEFFVLLKQ